MKSHSLKRVWVKSAALCALGLVVGMCTFRARADQWDKKTILTVNQPIQITDTYLDPGTYVLKLADSSSDRHIVYIFNANQNHLINTVMAIPNTRLRPTGNSEFVFWETPPGTARAMRAWFYPGDNFGQEFRYPKHLKELASASITTTQQTQTTTPVAPPEPAPAPEPQAQNEPAPKQEEAPLVAQNTPPPAPAATPEPAPTPAPQELPKTATPYPLIGLGGLLSLGLYALARIKRVA